MVECRIDLGRLSPRQDDSNLSSAHHFDGTYGAGAKCFAILTIFIRGTLRVTLSPQPRQRRFASVRFIRLTNLVRNPGAYSADFIQIHASIRA